MPSSMKTIIDQFTKRAGTYSGSAHWISDPALIRMHIEASGKEPPGYVLELCCGTGMVGRNFHSAGWSVCGIDLTYDMALEANRYFPCICAPADKVPFMDRAFDIVVLRQAYFLLEDGQKVLAEASRVLKDDGVFILSQTVPYSSEDADWLEKIHRAKQAQLRQFFTDETLVLELERDHFRVMGTHRVSVRENITRWMQAAPELSDAIREEVCGMIENAPESYQSVHKVGKREGELFEDWNWVVFTAGKKP